ncbi:polymeric immunoglobulin receptor-like [Astyanax mexicanus]|uniref:polymeric immunoglobulin receptor-like n=1 Tax=Astyanax mexicanus TaxID=7994 RepID=UPI0020CAEEA4|nr:polymeric immunoglobulin receptor-like [Astyanax mexicanus]
MQRFWIFIFFLSSIESGSSYRELSLQPGANITILCDYDKQYKLHKKYWCYDAGSAFNYCTIQAYANNTADRVTVTDYPDQNLFTVTMRNLQTGNTESYWCAVEIGGVFEADVKEQFCITVKSDPDVSVVESSVEGQEGGVVRVQCLYSAKYQSEQKQWCRSKDQRCYKAGRTNTSQNSAVQIRVDGRRSFSVEMSGLKKSDAGWYGCRVGTLEVPVHLSVSDAAPDPDVSVVESSVEGQEGGVVRIQCLYSAGYQSEQKQWCRSKDQWCYKVGRTHTSQNSAVQISDDGRSRSFSVEMSGLKKSDAGWYWCRVGKLEVPVHLSVNVGKSHSDSYKIVLGCLTVLLLLILLAAVAIWFLKKRRALTQQDQVKVKKEKKSGCNGNRAAPELSYSSVLFKKVTQKSKQRSPGSQKNSASEDPVIYSTIIDT